MQMLTVTGSLFIAAVLSHKSEIRSFADVTHEALTFTIPLSVISDAGPATNCSSTAADRIKKYSKDSVQTTEGYLII